MISRFVSTLRRTSCFSLFLLAGIAAAVASEGSCTEPMTDPLTLGDEAPLLAITACTGEAGSRVVTGLRDMYPTQRIRCLVRNNTTKPLDHLDGLESVRHVDFREVDSITTALQGASAVYLNTPPSLDVLQMRVNMAEACKQLKDKGLNHIVLFGEAVDIAWYGLTKYWDDHKAGEDAIQGTGIPVTVLHPSCFMEGFGTHFGNPQQIVESDSFSRVGTAPVAYTSIADVGVVTAKVLIEGPDIHGWKKYNLINDVMTGNEVAAAMTKALGRMIEYRPITVEEFRAGMVAGGLPEEFVEAYTLVVAKMAEGRFANDDRGQLEALLGRKPKSMVEVLLDLKPLLSKDNNIERVTNK